MGPYQVLPFRAIVNIGAMVLRIPQSSSITERDNLADFLQNRICHKFIL